MSYDERSFFAGKQEGRQEGEAEIVRLRAIHARDHADLSAEVDRLRAALRPFADAYDAVGEWGPNNTSTARLTQLRSHVMVVDFINARRALEDQSLRRAYVDMR